MMDFEHARIKLIDSLRFRGITDENVLKAMGKIPREFFVEKAFLDSAYVDSALPITAGQTISQPYIVALMTSAVLNGRKLSKILEIGTGSGYQAAVLSQLVDEVYSIERIKSLHQQAKNRFEQLNIDNIFLLYGDGALGWEEHAPYDGIIVTAAAENIPPALLMQLAEGARLVIPVNRERSHGQTLQVITRQGDEYVAEYLEAVVFVPLVKGKSEE